MVEPLFFYYTHLYSVFEYTTMYELCSWEALCQIFLTARLEMCFIFIYLLLHTCECRQYASTAWCRTKEWYRGDMIYCKTLHYRGPDRGRDCRQCNQPLLTLLHRLNFKGFFASLKLFSGAFFEWLFFVRNFTEIQIGWSNHQIFLHVTPVNIFNAGFKSFPECIHFTVTTCINHTCSLIFTPSSPNCCHITESKQLSRMSMYAVFML